MNFATLFIFSLLFEIINIHDLFDGLVECFSF